MNKNMKDSIRELDVEEIKEISKKVKSDDSTFEGVKIVDIEENKEKLKDLILTFYEAKSYKNFILEDIFYLQKSTFLDISQFYEFISEVLKDKFFIKRNICEKSMKKELDRINHNYTFNVYFGDKSKDANSVVDSLLHSMSSPKFEDIYMKLALSRAFLSQFNDRDLDVIIDKTLYEYEQMKLFYSEDKKLKDKEKLSKILK